MRILIFTIRDNKAEAYLRPFFERTNHTAIRAVKSAMKTGDQFEYPEDYALYGIGAFKDDTGHLETWPPMHLSNLIDILGTDEETMSKRGMPDGAATLQLRERRVAQELAEQHKKDFPALNLQGGE